MTPKSKKLTPSSALFFALAIMGGLAGCLRPGLFSTKPQWELDTARKLDGSTYERDTERNWQFYVALYETEVGHERQRTKPPGDSTSWVEYWHRHFAHLRVRQENPEKYIAFILDLRRKAGLPDLPKE
jgi:hypothetical protein